LIEKECKNIMQIQKTEQKLLKKYRGHEYEFRTWFIENSNHFHQVDVEKSMQLAKENNALVKQCYRNCWNIALGNRGYEYYEGFVWSEDIPIPIEHTWLVKDGKVIDPTLIIDNKTAEKQLRSDKEYRHLVTDKGFKIRESRIGDEYMGVNIPIDFVNSLLINRKKFDPNLIDYFLKMKTELLVKTLPQKWS